MTTLADVALISDLGACASYVLDTIAANLVALGVNVPTVRYRQPGKAVAWDGEQLTISLDSITPGLPGQVVTAAPHPAALVQFVSWDVMLLRFVPGLEANEQGGFMLPEPTEQDVSATSMLTDATALWLAAIQMFVAYQQHEANTPYAIGPAETVGPQGFVAGTLLRLSHVVL